MSLEQSVHDASAALRSDKATERRRNADTLKDLIAPAASLLSANKHRGSGLTWDSIFQDVHEFVLKECEKFESNRSFGNIEGISTNLFHLTVQGSIKGKAYIKCDTIIESCLFIIQNPRLTKAVGNVYIKLLHKYIMPCQHYLRYITPQAWEDLLTATVSISCRDQTHVDNLTNLRLIMQIIQNGSTHCHFTVSLRDIVHKLRRHYVQTNQENKIQEVLLGIGVLLLQIMSTESRLTMCEFTEAAIPVVIKFYQQNCDSKKKVLIFHFLELSVLLHHPQGRLRGEQGSLAHNWTIWDQHLSRIMELVMFEGEFLERTYGDTKFKLHSDCTNLQLCDHYVKLSALAVYQVIHSDCQNSRSSENGENPAKKLRQNKITTFSEIIDKLRAYPVPWISITSAYIQLYSGSISKMELVMILGVIDNCLSSTSNKIVWSDVQQVTSSLLSIFSKELNEPKISHIIQSLLSSCIRYSSVETNAHNAIHGIMQEMIELNLLTYHLPQLLKLYNEGAMLVTSNSVATLNRLLKKYGFKLDNENLKFNYIKWLHNIKLDTANVYIVSELLLRLISKENVSFTASDKSTKNKDELFDIVIDNSEANILATEFEIVLWNKQILKTDESIDNNAIQVNINVKEEIEKYVTSKLKSSLENFNRDRTQSQNLACYIELSLNYYCKQLNLNICSHEALEYSDLWNITWHCVDVLYEKMRQYDNKSETSDKYASLISLQYLLSKKHHKLIDEKLREGADEDFFRVLHGYINQDDGKSMNDDAFDVDETTENFRGSAIQLCAYYCKSDARYREDVLKLILDPELYQFAAESDIDIALWCMEKLIEDNVHKEPIELLFRLMQEMCKVIFRDTKSSIRLLDLLFLILEDIGNQPLDTMKNNCIIMLKGYLHRCESAYYPPRMMAQVYKCIAKISDLKHQHWNNTLCESILKGLMNPVNSLRLYSCYILNNFYKSMTENDLKNFLANLLDLFLIEISSDNEVVLKDEAANRTSTVLHAISAITLARPMWMTKTIASMLEIAKSNNIDKKLIKKVLNMLVLEITGQSAQEYLRNNLLSLVHYWFNMNVDVKEIPYEYFGYNSIEEFVKNHMEWLIPAEVLWVKKGNLSNSFILPWLKNELKVNEEIIAEACFSNMLTLCLPYFVHDKYDTTCPNWMSDKNLMEQGKLMYTAITEWVGSDKFSTLYGQSFYMIIMLATTFLFDPEQLVKDFRLKRFMVSPEPHQYSLKTYDLVLNYLGGIIRKDIVIYLCENQPLAISHILLNLWSQLESERILEAKLAALCRYITFFERIPLNTMLDTYVHNFICTSLLNTLKTCCKNAKLKEAVGPVCRAMHKVLLRILPNEKNTMEKFVPQVIAILKVVPQEAVSNDVDELLSYFLNDLQYCFKEGIDMVDDVLTQGGSDSCHTSDNFRRSLKNLILKLNCHSLETLNSTKSLIKSYSPILLTICKNLKTLKGFSEDCNDSIIHQLINSLTAVATKSEDKECIIIACDCLALIGPCDLKTLVMSTPQNQNHVMCVNPSQYMALITLKALAENIFDKNPRVIQNTTSALKSLLTFREGRFAMEQNHSQDHYFHPFIPRRKNQLAVKFSVSNESFDTIFNSPTSWIPSDNEKHDDWSVRVATNLINAFCHENTYLLELREVCKLKPSLSEKIIPACLGLLVSCANEHQVSLLGIQLTAFFQHFYVNTFYDSNSANSSGSIEKENSHHFVNRHKSSVETMLEAVDFVRLQRLQYKKRKDQAEDYNYLQINYHWVAWAACVTGHSMAAVLYGELWCIAQNEGVPPASPEVTAALHNGEDIQGMFRKSYVDIGEFDSVYGCGTGHLSSEAEKRNHILRLGNFSDALIMHDIALSHTSTDKDAHIHSLHRGVIQSMHMTGLYHLAVQYMKCLPEDTNLDDIKYECYSKLGDWSLIVDTSNLEMNKDSSISELTTSIKAYQYSCLKDSLNIVSTDGYESRLRKPLENAKICLSKLLQKSNIQNCQIIYDVTSNLKLLDEVEHYYDIRCKKLPLTDLLNKWNVTNLMPFDDFKHIEPVLSQRSLILEQAAKLDGSILKDAIALQLKYAELAMLNNRQQMSSRLVAMAKKLQPGRVISLMDARVYWANGHKDIALHLVKSIIHDNECTERILRANALWQYGRWMMELRNESGRDILDKYLKQSLVTLGDGGHIETQLKVYLDIARFADTEYEQVMAYMKSSTFENKVKCMKAMKGTACSIRELMSSQTPTRDETRALQTNDKLSKFEEDEITSTYNEKKRFLDLAMKYYLLLLSQGELSDLSIFRVISLWINNPTFEFDGEEDTLQQLLSAVPSRKFLAVLPQIAPRLSVDKTPFAVFLSNIIERCAVDHPHHTLPILLALSNSHKDQIITNANIKSTSQKTRTSTGAAQEEPRIVAAKNLIRRLSQTDESIEVIITQMDLMYNALISLAYYTSKEKQSKQVIPRSEPLTKLKNLNSVLVPIVNLPVNKHCIYTDIISVISFSSDYSLVGGVNAPKKMFCKGSDGVDRTILLKGEDDLRQDAVMQQVFTIVNNLLEMNHETSQRKLTIRTYKVVPLSRRSGVLEWCEGTVTIGSYLVGTQNSVGAHTKYRPKDITPSQARSMLTKCADKAKSKQQKLATFLEILSVFKPVFHHFFTENFLAPVTWYERRLAYTKSVATTSMVGYMLGLGDRHLQNILIDKKTAEVIHIDFGIAFDQARALPTPETVPFRLSQDIVAGFGPCGVEGVFRRSCEKTLQLLRDNQETLLTILEVLLCDPLYSWTITAVQAKQKQNVPATPRETTTNGKNGAGDSGGANSGSGPAERALLAVRSKLCGTEGSAGIGMAVPGLVARLVQQATDPANLAQLYHGWQAFL